jgi:hypothetical protein
LEILNKIEADFINALKNHNTLTLSVLRMLKSALKNAQIAKKEDLSEGEVFAVIEKQAKQRRDSAQQFRLGGRMDLVENEENELKVIESYLPKKMSREEMSETVILVIDDLKATKMSEMGLVVKEVLNRCAGKGDGKIISDLVREKLK